MTKKEIMKNIFCLILSLALMAGCGPDKSSSAEKEQYKIAAKYGGMMTQAVLETSRVDATIEQQILHQKQAYDAIKHDLPESLTSKMVILEKGYQSVLSSNDPTLINEAIDISVELEFELLNVLTAEDIKKLKENP
jgi:Skp family chaperone for outer membrane proteins